MSAAVEELAPRREAAKAATRDAMGMSLQVDLGAGRVCTLQTFIPNDCPQVELNAMLDKMTAAGARQRAAYKVEELERDLEKLQREHDQQNEDLAKVDADFDAAQAKREQHAVALRATIDKFKRTAEEAATAAGRRTGLSKQDQSYVERGEKGIETTKGEMSAAVEEHAKVRSEIQKTMERRTQVMEKARAEIARCKEIVAAGLKA